MEQASAVHLFVLDTMADWEPGYAIAAINSAEFQRQPGRYVVRTVGATGDAVRTMGGVMILPELTLASLQPEDSAMLILPGAASWDGGAHAEAIEKAREFLAAGVPVAAICGATGALARAGLLNGRRHTSNAREYLAAVAPGYRDDSYVDEAAVRDGELITASGTAPVDFARLILERLEVYTPDVLSSWYALYRHGDVAAFYALAAAEAGD